MSIVNAFNQFINDGKVQGLLLLIAVDIVLGVAAAIKLKTFNFGYVVTFLKDDILWKVLPYFVMYFAAIVSGGTNLLIPGLDFNNIADGIYALVVAAMVASILGSLADLGVSPVQKLPAAFKA